MIKNFTNTDAVMLDEIIENAGNVKISSGSTYTMIFIDGLVKCGLFFNKNKKTFQYKEYSKELVEDIINALGQPEDLGGEKILATLLLYEFSGSLL